jgi:zinc transporter, ZIP family
VIDAILLGAAAQTSLILSGLVVYAVRVPSKVIGALAGFGAGALVSAIAFDLIPEGQVLDNAQLALWMLLGAAVFVVSDHLVEARFGGEGGSGALGIVVGAVVDGIPESLIFGIQIAAGQPLSVAFVAAVWVSNIPQALAPSADLAESGWRVGRMVLMWSAVVVACGVTAGLGYLLAENVAGVDGGRAAAFAAGGLLAMLTDSLMPYAFQRAGAQAGIWTVVGFAAAMSSA